MYTEDTDNERAWYIIQSYVGMEYAAKRNLERRIVSMNMEDYKYLQILLYILNVSHHFSKF